MRLRMPHILLAACFLLPAARESYAQKRDQSDDPQVVRATGQATVQAQPDEVWLDVGVVTQAATAQEAAAENARKVEKVLSALRTELGPGTTSTITTVNYSLNPDYGPSRDGGEPVLRGYVASNIVEVRTGDLAKVGRLIDAAIKADANNINRVEFKLKNQSQAMAKALREATLEARAKTESMASALGLRVVRVVAIDEGANLGRYLLTTDTRMRMSGEQMMTQIESGSIDVHAVVTVTAEMGP